MVALLGQLVQSLLVHGACSRSNSIEASLVRVAACLLNVKVMLGSAMAVQKEQQDAWMGPNQLADDFL